MTPMNWSRVHPVFPVADVAAAIEWYSCVLGFKSQLVNPTGNAVPVYAVLNRDEDPDGNVVWVTQPL